MGMRTDAEYRAMGIPNQSPFDWRVDSVPLTRKQIYMKERWKKQMAERGQTTNSVKKAQITRQNPTVDLSAYSVTSSEKAPR